MAGTDTPTPWIELPLLSEAGIPPLQVIKIATQKAARALGHQKDFGTIQRGLRADLLSQNPLQSIANTRAIAFVIQRGRIVRN